MIREYRTIKEIVSPLMMIRGRGRTRRTRRGRTPKRRYPQVQSPKSTAHVVQLLKALPV